MTISPFVHRALEARKKGEAAFLAFCDSLSLLELEELNQQLKRASALALRAGLATAAPFRRFTDAELRVARTRFEVQGEAFPEALTAELQRRGWLS